MRFLHGVGFGLKGEFCATVNSKGTPEYELWRHMLQRCYSQKFHVKHPTYEECEASENFKNFQYFAEWCQRQIGFGETGYQLDKDIIFKGNKLYSEDTCFFVPRSLNMFLVNCSKSNREFPIGVHRESRTGRLKAYCNNGEGENKYLGTYTTKEEAFMAYKVYKESRAKELAIKYEGLVHPKVIEALNNYVVEITD